MKIAIYQINPDRDENNVAFLNYENLERFQGSAALRSEIYDKVFEGEVECGTLEEVYQMFNIGQPDGYRGRSLSQTLRCILLHSLRCFGRRGPLRFRHHPGFRYECHP